MSDTISLSSPETLLATIKAHRDGLSEYQLLKLIYQGSDTKPPDLADSLVLFQQHFYLFHTLYLLRDKLHALQSGTLVIDVLNIQWLPSAEASGSQPSINDSLRSYYLDLSNLNNTDRDQVEDLLTGFWRAMADNSEQSIALEALALTEPVTWSEIKKRYRQSISECHPDRGGCHKAAAKLNNAMAILERCYR